MPDGSHENINPDGVRYYHDVIDALIAEGITPMITLYHWDLPSVLHEEYGGWENDSMIDFFAEYARFCFNEYGDKVRGKYYHY